MASGPNTDLEVLERTWNGRSVGLTALDVDAREGDVLRVLFYAAGRTWWAELVVVRCEDGCEHPECPGVRLEAVKS